MRRALKCAGKEGFSVPPAPWPLSSCPNPPGLPAERPRAVRLTDTVPGNEPVWQHTLLSTRTPSPFKRKKLGRMLLTAFKWLSKDLQNTPTLISNIFREFTYFYFCHLKLGKLSCSTTLHHSETCPVFVLTQKPWLRSPHSTVIFPRLPLFGMGAGFWLQLDTENWSLTSSPETAMKAEFE